MTLARLRPTASLPTAMAFAARRRPASTKEAIRPLTRSPLSAPLLSRRLHLQGLALAPVVFGGLFVALWTWKCFMMVIFQNKIIYMPGLPPNARWESIKDYSRRCAGISWREERLRAADGTDLALCLADIDLGRRSTTILPDRTSSLGSEDRSPPRGLPPPIPVYILYFQGSYCIPR